jgi:hypothetical protein
VCNADTITPGGHFLGRKGPSPPPEEPTKSSSGLAARKVKRLASCCAVAKKEGACVRIQPASMSGGAHIIVDGRPEPKKFTETQAQSQKMLNADQKDAVSWEAGPPTLRAHNGNAWRRRSARGSLQHRSVLLVHLSLHSSIMLCL